MKQEVELQIVDGEKKYLSDCIKILQDSDLGNAYFSDEQKAKEQRNYMKIWVINV